MTFKCKHCKEVEYALNVMRRYYEYQMDHNVGLKKEYYRGKFEAVDVIQRHIILSEKVQVDYYEQFLKDKGKIRGCFNCSKNPEVNKKLTGIGSCYQKNCYEPNYEKWELL